MRHEAAASSWLDDLAGTLVDPESEPLLAAERSDNVDRAIRIVVEHLNPAERAAFVLRRCFDYPYRTIADLLDLNLAHVRQLVSRAQARLLRLRNGGGRRIFRRSLPTFRLCSLH